MVGDGAACADLARVSAAARADACQCPAVALAGSLSAKDAEKGTHKILKLFGLSLNVKISKAELLVSGEPLRIAYLKPSDYLAKLLGYCAEAVWGREQRPQQRCQSFWKAYYAHHPGHEVYAKFGLSDLGNVVPILLHGDEGTGSKKQPVAIVNWQTPWGPPGKKASRVAKESDFNKCSLCASKKSAVSSCCKVPEAWADRKLDAGMSLVQEDFDELLTQFPSTTGHSAFSRHLVFVLPTHLLKKGTEVLDGMLGACAEDLRSLFSTGVMVGSTKYYGALVGCKGDSKWHATVAKLLRSYTRLGEVNCKPICAECLGGDPLFPFEQTGDDAKWVETLYESVPWDPAFLGPLESIPFDIHEPARKYKRDLLHVFKIGLGRDVAGGIMTLLSRFFRWFDAPGDSISLDNRLKRMHARFSLFCLADGRCPHLRCFTKDSMHMPRVDSYAFTNTKGSDTMLLMLWLKLECNLALASHRDHPRKDLLQVSSQACAASIEMFRVCYSHGLFLPRPCMVTLRDEMLRVTRGYNYLAKG
ncbi:unnamed protein product, partial [Symbiodinium pilosum]